MQGIQAGAIQNGAVQDREARSELIEGQNSFASELGQAIENLNGLQEQSSVMTERLARGEAENMHDVTIASEMASTALQTGVEIRNRAVESYQRVMQMQI
ncbi:flagellar hook-basal body complex protein FliE [Salsuginibacillus halophilus]|nr:flagellar hook-basal body complex protein FliE [Salsuginibacillus halophilus]